MKKLFDRSEKTNTTSFSGKKETKESTAKHTHIRDTQVNV